MKKKLILALMLLVLLFTLSGCFIAPDPTLDPLTITEGVAPTQSLFRVDAPNVIIDTVKIAEDGSGDLILRLYESKKCDTCCTLTTALPVQSAVLCDMMEQAEAELPASSSIPLHLQPFEILTLRLKTK